MIQYDNLLLKMMGKTPQTVSYSLTFERFAVAAVVECKYDWRLYCM